MLMLTSPELVTIDVVRLVELYDSHFHSVPVPSAPLFLATRSVTSRLCTGMARTVGTGLLALLVGIAFLEPKLRYMRSIEYWHDNMRHGPNPVPCACRKGLRDKIRNTESCSYVHDES